MRIGSTSAITVMSVDGRGFVTNAIPNLTIRNIFTEGALTVANTNRLTDVLFEDSAFLQRASYGIQSDNTNVVIRSSVTVATNLAVGGTATVAGYGLFQDFLRVTGAASLGATATPLTLATSGNTGTIYTGDGTSYGVTFASRSGSSDTPYLQIAEGVGVKVAKSAFFTSLINAGTITGNQDNYNPASLSVANVIRIASDASRDITGLQTFAGMDGRMLVIHNIGAQNIVLKDQSGSSFATNRFEFDADKTILPNTSVMLFYDGTTLAWRCIGL